MADVVVDTDVVSFFFKRDPLADLYRPHLRGNRLFLSFMTQAELDLWVLVKPWTQAETRRLRHHLKRFAVYPHSRGLSKIWASVIAEARGNRFTFPPSDAWTAASALALQAPVITHNRDDFRGVARLTVISESNP